MRISLFVGSFDECIFVYLCRLWWAVPGCIECGSECIRVSLCVVFDEYMSMFLCRLWGAVPGCWNCGHEWLFAGLRWAWPHRAGLEHPDQQECDRPQAALWCGPEEGALRGAGQESRMADATLAQRSPATDSLQLSWVSRSLASESQWTNMEIWPNMDI